MEASSTPPDNAALRSITQSPQLQPADDGFAGTRTSVDAANTAQWQTYNLVQNLEAEASLLSFPLRPITILQPMGPWLFAVLTVRFPT
jgi:hypothetical protein